MARLRSPTKIIHHGSTVPQFVGNGTNYPFGSTSFNQYNSKLDVFASLLVRTYLWNVSIQYQRSVNVVLVNTSGSPRLRWDGNGDVQPGEQESWDYIQSINISILLTTSFTPPLLSEKNFAYNAPDQSFISAANLEGIPQFYGNLTGIYNPPSDPPSELEGRFIGLGGNVSWTSESHIENTGNFYMYFFAGMTFDPDTINGLPPFGEHTGFVTSAGDPPDFSNLEESGDFKIRIPDWRGTGNPERKCNIYGLPFSSFENPNGEYSGNQSWDVSIVMTPNKTAAYGLDVSSPKEYTVLNSIWSDAGNAIQDPLNPTIP